MRSKLASLVQHGTRRRRWLLGASLVSAAIFFLNIGSVPDSIATWTSWLEWLGGHRSHWVIFGVSAAIWMGMTTWLIVLLLRSQNPVLASDADRSSDRQPATWSMVPKPLTPAQEAMKTDLDRLRVNREIERTDRDHHRDQIVRQGYPLFGRIETCEDADLEGVRKEAINYVRYARGTVESFWPVLADKLLPHVEEDAILRDGEKTKLASLVRTYATIFNASAAAYATEPAPSVAADADPDRDEETDEDEPATLIETLERLRTEGQRFRSALMRSRQGGTSFHVQIAKMARTNLSFGMRVNGWSKRLFSTLEEAGYPTKVLMRVQTMDAMEAFFSASDDRLADLLDSNLAVIEDLLRRSTVAHD